MDTHFTSAIPAELKCEHRINPLGIDSKNPGLEWITKYHGYNSFQSAYRIIVSESTDFSKVVWDTGKFTSPESVCIIYSGLPLTSNFHYHWKVRIWNENNEPSQWSEPAHFTTGLFEQAEWKAEWISHVYSDENENEIRFHEGKDCWIWHPIKNKEERFTSVVLIRPFAVILGDLISAEIIITADEKFSLFINDVPAAESDDKIFSWARPKSLDIKGFLTAGNNNIRIKATNSYVDEPGVLFRMELKYSGRNEIISSNGNWLCCFENEKTFINASVLRKTGDKHYRIPHAGLKFNPAAYFRKTFRTCKKINKAFIHCSSLGLYHLFLNGEKLNDGFLQPGWSDFNKSVFYDTYDVAATIKNENVINVILADGYYAGYCGWEKGRSYYGSCPALKLQLMIEYSDGSKEIIITDGTWLSSEGPIREADILMGEYYDSDKEYLIKDWDKYNFGTTYFKPVGVLNKNIIMVAYTAEHVTIKKELRPCTVKKFSFDKFIVDFGQNFAGFIRLNLHNAGRRNITIRFAEVLNSDGSLYVDNLRMARAADTYFSNGSAEETWQPLFTYHGFRYAEISGLEQVDGNTITGISINSLPVQTAFFTSSNSILNKLVECILWNQRSNYVDIPTDCPQRDERFGWTGDASIYFQTAALNHDVSAFYTKWFRTLYEAQTPEGLLPPFSPAVEMGVGPRFYNSAGWADAGIVSLYQFYIVYNDYTILEKYYENMKLFMDSLLKQSREYILPEYGYGDWLSSGRETSKSLIATAYFAYDASLMEKIASILGRHQDAVYFKKLFQSITSAYRNTFLGAKGSIKFTQTSAVLSLYFDLLEENEKEEAACFLIKDIIENNYLLKTGFLGLAYIMPVLSSDYFNSLLNSLRTASLISLENIGKNAAWKILTNNTYPSWFFMINNGATTLWERWDAWHPEKGFFDPTMNSFNHCSLGSVGEWFYNVLAGISLKEPAYKSFQIKPFFPEDLQFVKASLKTKNGSIVSEWSRLGVKIIMHIIVPFNTSAEVFINSAQFDISNDYIMLRQENKCTVIKIGSGSYTISFKIN